MEQEIELREIVAIISKRRKLIVSLCLLAVIGSYVISNFYIKPVYSATTTILVGRPAEGYRVVFQDVELNRQLVKTYVEIAHSSRVASAVIDELRLRMSVAQLQSMISIRQVGDTELIAISVRDFTPDRAAFLANGVAEIFISQIAKLMHVDNVAVIDVAIAPSSPIYPRPWPNMAIAVVFALMTGLFLTFVLEYMDNTLKTRQDVERILQLPVLGTIPLYEGETDTSAARTWHHSAIRGENFTSCPAMAPKKHHSAIRGENR